MFRTSMPKRVPLLTRSALGVALALGVVAGGAMLATPAIAAKQPAFKFSPGFQKVAAPLQKAIDDAKTRADVIAAKQKVTDSTNSLQQARLKADRDQAKAARDAALAELGAALSNEKTQLEAAFAAITNADDRFMAGNLALSLGGLSQDLGLQRRGLQTMLESGKTPAADVPRFNFYVGQFSFQLGEYAAARTALQSAIDGGYFENDGDTLLAEAYMSDNQVAQGLAVLKQAIERRKASGTPAPVNWYRRGLGAAYKAQLLNQAADFSMALVQDYPSSENWAGAITVVREIGKYPAQETLDLMRLMGRTNSYAEERDYVEYIQAADPRRLPGEALKVLKAGLAAGKLRSGDVFVSEAQTIANQRIEPDRASLPGLERDARAANATGATVAGAGDAFLSYDQPAKAEEFYTMALGKTGVDTARVLTRLGIAQVDQGKFAAAQETFGKVDGVRKPLAQLWAIYAAQKAVQPAN